MISVNEINGMLVTKTPYNKDYIAAAKAAGGRWDAEAKAWVFPSASRPKVREMVQDCYGVDIDNDTGTVMAEITIRDGVAGYPTLAYGPYQIAYAKNKQEPPMLCRDVALVSGSLESGGSWKNPSVYAKTDVVVRMQLPRSVIGQNDTARMTARIAE